MTSPAATAPQTLSFLRLPSSDRSQREDIDSRVGYLDAYGLGVETEINLPGAQASPVRQRNHAVRLVRAAAEELPSLFAQPRYLRNFQVYDGAPYAMLEAVEGDVLFAYGRTALAHLSADRRVLRYVAGAEPGPASQRVLVDTILWTVSLLHGFVLLHASAICGDHGLVGLVARMGGGKSTLAAEFVRRGAALFSDDIVALDDGDGQVVAYPGPPLMNLPSPLTPEVLGGGSILADFGDERWVQLDRVDTAAQAFAAVVILHRMAREHPRCERIEATSLTLLPHGVSLPHLEDHARRRFDIFGGVVAHAPIFSLHADPALPPSDLADLVECQVAAA